MFPFKNPYELEEAVNQLLDLKQATTVQAFYLKFKNLLLKSKFDPFSAITVVRQGLKPSIRKSKMKRRTRPTSNNLPPKYASWTTVKTKMKNVMAVQTHLLKYYVKIVQSPLL